jgi:hypothetical protein
MSTPWAAVQASDITSRWRPLTDAETEIVDTIILDAQDIVEDAAVELGIPELESNDGRRRRKYIRVVATMVKRVLINPEGLLSEGVDDYTYRRDSAVSSGALYVSDDEMEELRPVVEGRRRRGAFTVKLG